MNRSTQRQVLDAAYGLPFPDGFFAFWAFTGELAAHGVPLEQSVLQIRLGSAFDVCRPDFEPADYQPLWTSRYAFDPPEFVTLLHGATDGLHWGYYVDEPATPAFPVAAYYHRDAVAISVAGNDLFEACRAHLEASERDSAHYLAAEPAAAATYRQQREQVAAIRAVLTRYATGDRPETGTAYLDRYGLVRRPTAPTRDGMGILVPPDTYRPLVEPDPYQDWDYVPTADEVAGQAQAARGALAAGFAGTVLKLGKDLWAYRQYGATAAGLLDEAYAALDRPVLGHWLAVAHAFRAAADARRP